MLRILILIVSLVLSNIAIAASDPYAPYVFSEAAKTEIEQIDKLYQRYTTITTRFVQGDSLGNKATGWFAIQKPGKARVEYDNIPISLIANANSLLLHDTKLKQKSFVPINSSPFAYLLQKEMSLLSNQIIITNYESTADHIEITIISSQYKEIGAIKLVISKENGELLSWTVYDAKGVETSIFLVDAKFDNKHLKNQAIFNTQRVVEHVEFKDVK